MNCGGDAFLITLETGIGLGQGGGKAGFGCISAGTSAGRGSPTPPPDLSGCKRICSIKIEELFTAITPNNYLCYTTGCIE